MSEAREASAKDAQLSPADQARESGYRITPMFEQYLAVKAQYPDSLLLYRMGDFYEVFFEDAVICARELQLALTCRNRDKTNPIPMCGVPWHTLEAYTSQLVDKGYTIAVCDQVEDPKQAQGLVKREVTRIITPGTLIEDANLAADRHNWLGAVFAEKGNAGFVWADISTGQWSGLEGTEAAVWQWVAKYAPRELILPDDLELPQGMETGGMRLVRRGRAAFDAKQCLERLFRAQNAADLATLGMQSMRLLPRACGAMLAYLSQTQKRDPEHMLPFRPADTGRCLIVDEVTERNLEIFTRLNGTRGRGTLRHVMDGTRTPMGGRYLEDMLRGPLRDARAISAIQDAVACLLEAGSVRSALREALDGVFDLERLSTRICLNRATPKDYAALRASLQALPAVRAALESLPEAKDAAGAPVTVPLSLKNMLAAWDGLDDCRELLERALAEPAPTLITEGGIFRHGYSAELDHWLDVSEHAEQLLQQQAADDQARAGALKLKLGSNRVFGYYYEISRAQDTSSLPEDFVRRQTLANAERYTTQGLKKLEEDILQAAERRCSLEYKLFQELRGIAAAYRPRLIAISKAVAELDYWQGLAQMARERGWVRPEFVEEPDIHILEGRHPVVEDMAGRAAFVPNSFTLDRKRRLCLLTGPNMAGKSTVLRQVAIICLMAQTGSFVPAAKARLGIVDRLFSRVGASDNLAQGQSTFMVEMMETARILRQCTKRSLIILDEIGRGTSTYDGLALAWAVAEDLAGRFDGSLRTLFATHYHELTRLEGQIPGVFTMNIAIKEFNRNVIFLHKLVPGPADRSYGVEVARLAGVPSPVVARARELLDRFESLREQSQASFASCMGPALLPGLESPARGRTKKAQADPAVSPAQAAREHPLEAVLRDLDPESLTPLAALSLIAEWKKIWGTPADGSGGQGTGSGTGPEGGSADGAGSDGGED